MVLAAVRQAADSYYQALPERVFSTVAKSAIYTFSAAILFTVSREKGIDLLRPLAKAAAAAVASLIHALMTPLFNKIFETQKAESLHELAKMGVVEILASAVVEFAMTSKVNLAAFRFIPCISSNWFYSIGPQPANGQAPFQRENAIYFAW